MKSVLVAALAFAACALATGDHHPSYPEQTVTLPPKYEATTSVVYETVTTVCPVTETKTIGGSTITKTYLTTSLVTITKPTTIEQYTTLAPVTKTFVSYVYSTSTSLCPVTTTKTVSGYPVEVIYTSTSVIVVKVPTTIVEYTTAIATEYETTKVYTTQSAYETVYTTVSAGHTVVLTYTVTGTVLVTKTYTVTSVAKPPITKATVSTAITIVTSVPVTQILTYPSERTSTANGGTFYSTVLIPVSSTFIPPPAVVTPPPTTILTTASPVPTTSAPIQISSGAAAPTNAPMALAVVGAMAVLALA
ncbi:hypothetical protein B0O99DRAFT_150882 [Bisporella sp. PMI_857]|nr:hypothetical protein B0O99DRAFT_150882 [Bisporella sp. PMI_857]